VAGQVNMEDDSAKIKWVNEIDWNLPGSREQTFFESKVDLRSMQTLT
jgi:hypothetical protein